MNGHESTDGVAPAPAPPPDGALSAITGRVVVWYALLASVWIVVSDLVFGSARGEAAGARLADIGKGLLFVAVSAALLWAVLGRLTRSFDRLFARTVTDQRDFYQSILRTSSDMILIFGADGTVEYASDAITDILGWEPGEVVGRAGTTLLDESERMSAVSFRENAARSGRNRRTFLMLHRDGGRRAVEITVSAITLHDGRPGAVVNGRDVTERARGEQQLRAALAEDATGLPNLRMFVAEMERLEQVSVVGLSMVVALVDVDRFGDINALHGRAAGDAVLLELTRRIEATVPEAIGMWRHGADEILLVVLEGEQLPEGGSGADLGELVDRLQREASAPMALDESTRRMSIDVAVGVTRVDLDHVHGGDALSSRVLREVEGALAEAKTHPDRSAVRAGRARRADGDRARLVAQLHEAIERGELVTHFQPKVRLDDLRIVGAEALVRWQHPERGLLHPHDFLGVVEEANLMPALSRAVLRDALGRVAGWLDSPACDPEFCVAVNLSLGDLRRKRFADDVSSAIHDSGVDASRLVLELTEQTMLADAVGARDVLDGLRRSGIKVAIDDFGTGYSSLEHIRVFEVDELKIDKSFVQRLGRSRTDEAIVDSVIAIAQRLGVLVTAEGIEDLESLDYLRRRGCTLGQGYLFDRPVAADAFDPGQRFDVLA